MTKNEIKKIQGLLWASSMDRVLTATSELDGKILVTLYIKGIDEDTKCYLDAIISTAEINDCVTNKYDDVDGYYNVVLYI